MNLSSVVVLEICASSRIAQMQMPAACDSARDTAIVGVQVWKSSLVKAARLREECTVELGGGLQVA